MLNEDSIIHCLKTAFPEHIGDDAAVLSHSSDVQQVITHDLLIEDVHFRLRYQDAASLAHKALHVNLSDVAAMGATPQHVLLGLSIPFTADKIIQDFLQHFAVACKAQHVLLIGGDTTASPDKLFISVTALGYAKLQHLKHRHTAKPGDIVCVAGQLGEAHLGFLALEHNQPGLLPFKTAFLKPHARVAEGIWLGQQTAVTSMMDISDGLMTDLDKLTKASEVSATLHLEKLNPSLNFETACRALNITPQAAQLTGGEDYGLLLTIAPEHYTSCASLFLEKFGYALQPLGEIEAGRGVHFTWYGKTQTLQLQAFSHF